MHRVVVACFVLFLSTSLSALEPPTAAIGLRDEIIVTASALPETLGSTPAAATVISAEEIERSAARDIAEVLRTVPGLIVARSGGAGSATSLFTRGASSTHTLVLWNGIEINNPYFAGYDWGRFSTAGVERVEVIRGPFSALYGSDAVAGVVNVLTTSIDHGFEADVQAGAHGLVNGRAAAATSLGALHLEAIAEHRNDDGWNDNEEFRQDSFSLGASFTRGTFSSSLYARATEYHVGIPFNVNADGTALVASPERENWGDELQIIVPIHFSTGPVTWNAALSNSRRDDRFRDPSDPFGFTSSATDSEVLRGRITATAMTRIGGFVAGVEAEDARVTDVSSFGTNLDDNSSRGRAAFAEHRFSRALSGETQLEIATGVRWDDYDSFGDHVSPRIAGSLMLGPVKIRASYGEAFRAPSIGELYFPFAGNRDLQPETSRSAEAGVDYFVGRRGIVSLTLFDSRFNDLITFDNSTYGFRNIGRASSSGVELSAGASLAKAFEYQVSYTWTDAHEEPTGAPLPRRPKHSGSLRLDYNRDQLGLSASLVHNGAREDVLPIMPYGRVTADAWTTVDLTARWTLATIEPYLKIENATGNDYEEIYGYPAPGRRVVAGVRYRTQ